MELLRFLNPILGEAGTLVLLILIVYGFVNRHIVPGAQYEEAEKRSAMLNREHDELNALLVAEREEKTKLMVQLAETRVEIKNGLSQLSTHKDLLSESNRRLAVLEDRVRRNYEVSRNLEQRVGREDA